MLRTIHGPTDHGRRSIQPPASSKFSGRNCTEEPKKNYSMRTLGKYLGYLDRVREYCRSFDDISYRGPSPQKPGPFEKGPVLDVLRNCDTRDQDVMRAVIEIAERGDDKDIRAAAQKAILLRLGRAFTGITPQL